MRIHLLLIVAMLSCSPGGTPGGTGSQEAERAAPPEVRETTLGRGEREVLVQNLNTPWSIDFLPDERMIFTERGGRVSILEDGNRRSVGSVRVHERGEGGLHGVTVDPEFARNQFVYLYYTRQGGNRVSRFTLRDGLSLEGETVILDDIPSARFHNGGRIRFGPDGKLFITTGDAQNPRLSQDRNSLAGKILRLNKDGSVPDDNPFRNPVWAYGIRNAQGIDWSPAGELYASDHGPNRRDAVMLIRRGANYGWPTPCDRRTGDQAALRCYTEFTLAPCGVAFSDGSLFVAGLRGTQVRRLEVSGGELRNEEQFLSGLGRIRDVVARDGWLYVATSNRDGRGNARSGDDQILRIRIAD